jgi:hypothetical protein
MVNAAGISRESFYARFNDGRDAAGEATRLMFRAMIGPITTAFLSARGWPNRVCSATTRGAEILTSSPALARFAFLGSHGVDAATARQADDFLMAFTIFLQWGQRYHLRTVRDGLGAVIAQATATALWEISASCFWQLEPEQLAAVLPFACYLVLAPYVGAEEAMSVISRHVDQRSGGLLP